MWDFLLAMCEHYGWHNSYVDQHIRRAWRRYPNGVVPNITRQDVWSRYHPGEEYPLP